MTLLPDNATNNSRESVEKLLFPLVIGIFVPGIIQFGGSFYLIIDIFLLE